MSLIKKYESRGVIETVDYVTFFCEKDEHDDWVEAIMLTRDDGLPSGETIWCVAYIQIPRDEIDKFAVMPETDDQDYSTQGWSIACSGFEEMIDELRACAFEEGDEMEMGAREFFGF